MRLLISLALLVLLAVAAAATGDWAPAPGASSPPAATDDRMCGPSWDPGFVAGPRIAPPTAPCPPSVGFTGIGTAPPTP
jgi:hypothetical protein